MDELGHALPTWLGTRAYDAEGARVGHVADVLFDESTQRPAWLLLVLLRARERFVLVPARGVVHHAGAIALPVLRELVRDAPVRAVPPGELGAEHAHALARHYGVRVGTGPWRGIVEPDVARAADRVRMAG